MFNKLIFIQIDFTQNEIDNIRESTKTIRYSHVYYDKGSRWIGEVGEEAFRRWLDLEKVVYTDLTGTGPSWIDFKVAGLKIDVKTTGQKTRAMPNDEWGINFTKDQYDRMETAEPRLQPNCFVFCRFIGELNRVIFVGVKSKKHFDMDKREIPKGTVITEDYTVPEHQYEIFIRDCAGPDEFIKYARLHQKLV